MLDCTHFPTMNVKAQWLQSPALPDSMVGVSISNTISHENWGSHSSVAENSFFWDVTQCRWASSEQQSSFWTPQLWRWFLETMNYSRMQHHVPDDLLLQNNMLLNYGKLSFHYNSTFQHWSGSNLIIIHSVHVLLYSSRTPIYAHNKIISYTRTWTLLPVSVINHLAHGDINTQEYILLLHM